MAFSLDIAPDGTAVHREVPTLSPLFITFLDWCVHKAPFMTWLDYQHIIDRETTHKFLTACYEQHSAPGARAKLAAGQSNCTSFMLTFVLTLSICFW